jgi:hypothetical protein
MLPAFIFPLTSIVNSYTYCLSGVSLFRQYCGIARIKRDTGSPITIEQIAAKALRVVTVSLVDFQTFVTRVS